MYPTFNNQASEPEPGLEVELDLSATWISGRWRSSTCQGWPWRRKGSSWHSATESQSVGMRRQCQRLGPTDAVRGRREWVGSGVDVNGPQRDKTRLATVKVLHS